MNKSAQLAQAAANIEPAVLEALNAAVKKAEKDAKLTPVFLSRESFAANATTTGSLEIDRILGGGIPPGRIVGIAGPEHTGKSLIATQIAAEQLKMGRIASYLDAEGGNDPLFLKARGIDFDRYRGQRDKNGNLKPGQKDTLLYYQPETGEQVNHYMWNVMSSLPENRSPKFPIVIFLLDSVVALVSSAVAEDLDSNRMAMHAKMYSEILPTIVSQLSRTGCTFVYTNQLRQKPAQMFGDPSYEPAGDSLKFYSSIRLRLSSSKPKVNEDKDHPFVSGFIADAKPRQGGVWEEPHLNEKGEEVGLDRYIYTAIRTVKNKVYTPQKVCWMRVHFEEAGGTGRGLDPVFDLFTFLYNMRALEKVKEGYKLVDTKWKLQDLGVPEVIVYQDFKRWVMSDPSIVAKVRQRVIIDHDAIGSSNNAVNEEDSNED